MPIHIRAYGYGGETMKACGFFGAVLLRVASAGSLSVALAGSATADTGAVSGPLSGVVCAAVIPCDASGRVTGAYAAPGPCSAYYQGVCDGVRALSGTTESSCHDGRREVDSLRRQVRRLKAAAKHRR